ncbi:FAD-dependent oxidoreductase [Limibacter armeniacum]|uniref:flavin monoamine oxidase family protein n=1 Tax=Limibacter armeniacum TaxID=466084 RepID=UPI002FE51864
MQKLIIIGAGISGLSAGYFLKQNGFGDFLILEAADQIGGRVKTIFHEELPIEMGPTWLGLKHKALVSLLEVLEVDIFPQFEEGIAQYEMSVSAPVQSFTPPPNSEPSYRIGGGTSGLIHKLVEKVGHEKIKTGAKVISISEKGEELILQTEKGEKFSAAKVIVTIPPQLLVNTVSFAPEIPANTRMLLENTYTWMSLYTKVAVVYAAPFWKAKGFSGMAFSQSGPMNELYDHSDVNGKGFALKGFLSLEQHYKEMSKAAREEAVIRQLVKFFGEEAANYTAYYEMDWSEVPLTSVLGKDMLPSKHLYGHPLYTHPLFNGKLLLSGTETDAEYGGYMDGAVRAAKFSTDWFLKK